MESVGLERFLEEFFSDQKRTAKSCPNEVWKEFGQKNKKKEQQERLQIRGPSICPPPSVKCWEREVHENLQEQICIKGFKNLMVQALNPSLREILRRLKRGTPSILVVSAVVCGNIQPFREGVGYQVLLLVNIWKLENNRGNFFNGVILFDFLKLLVPSCLISL